MRATQCPNLLFPYKVMLAAAGAAGLYSPCARHVPKDVSLHGHKNDY